MHGKELTLALHKMAQINQMQKNGAKMQAYCKDWGGGGGKH